MGMFPARNRNTTLSFRRLNVECHVVNGFQMHAQDLIAANATATLHAVRF